MREHIERAMELGREAGRNAGEWAADGNSSEEGIRAALAGLEEGDPMVWDFLPAQPNLSGEWADDPTPLSLAREITGEEWPAPEVMDAIAEAWEAGVIDTFEPSCAATLRAFLPES